MSDRLSSNDLPKIVNRSAELDPRTGSHWGGKFCHSVTRWDIDRGWSAKQTQQGRQQAETAYRTATNEKVEGG
ncbi:MAG: hypothetical protein ACYDC1_15885 [Limisphaerales bacterium]